MSDIEKIRAAKAWANEAFYEDERAGVKEPSSARIQDQLNYMQENISVAFSLMQKLAASLEPLLLPEGDVNAVDVGPKGPVFLQSPISRTIDDYNGQLIGLQNLIGNTTERLQL